MNIEDKLWAHAVATGVRSHGDAGRAVADANYLIGEARKRGVEATELLAIVLGAVAMEGWAPVDR